MVVTVNVDDPTALESDRASSCAPLPERFIVGTMALVMSMNRILLTVPVLGTSHRSGPV
ncbi:hypothetical protein [Micromonospora sp. WMMD736]|uniref:hypothetical protein n=1 Tax=Micromonospora sp. WMMD736 TaxID=3404112 RepID=UPI003B965AC2